MDHIKKVIREQSKDFDGKFSDAKIMREYLKGIARNTYYKYKLNHFPTSTHHMQLSHTYKHYIIKSAIIPIFGVRKWG